jgi:hypothetical protein
VEDDHVECVGRPLLGGRESDPCREAVRHAVCPG